MQLQINPSSGQLGNYANLDNFEKKEKSLAAIQPQVNVFKSNAITTTNLKRAGNKIY